MYATSVFSRLHSSIFQYRFQYLVFGGTYGIRPFLRTWFFEHRNICGCVGAVDQIWRIFSGLSNEMFSIVPPFMEPIFRCIPGAAHFEGSREKHDLSKLTWAAKLLNGDSDSSSSDKKNNIIQYMEAANSLTVKKSSEVKVPKSYLPEAEGSWLRRNYCNESVLRECNRIKKINTSMARTGKWRSKRN